jgi:hypothetical protein
MLSPSRVNILLATFKSFSAFMILSPRSLLASMSIVPALPMMANKSMLRPEPWQHS